MGKSKGKGNTGKRYTEKEKRRVVEFVNSQGRGGVIAAQRKFGVSYIAINSWRKKFGLDAPPKIKAGSNTAVKTSDIQREISRQIKPYIAQLVRVKAGIKALIQAL